MNTELTGQEGPEATAPQDGPVGSAPTLDIILAKNRAIGDVLQLRRERDDLIRAALAAGECTKAELARQLGMSEMQVGRIERGQTSGYRRAFDE